MELKREMFFNGKDINIDAVSEAITNEPWRVKEILEFIAEEMHKEVELKEKLDELKEDYHTKKHELYKEYGMEHLIY